MKIWLLFILGGIAGTSQAAPRTVTLSVPTMDCPVCPITVKKALGKVPGVGRTEVDFAKRQATVSYDDALASVESLTRATRDAGYPSTPMDTPK
ncbi:MAG: mercury resistance system periplasmic binding protein MerP [Methylibium sp.]